MAGPKSCNSITSFLSPKKKNKTKAATSKSSSSSPFNVSRLRIRTAASSNRMNGSSSPTSSAEAMVAKPSSAVAVSLSTSNKMISLGTGSMSRDGMVSFVPSPRGSSNVDEQKKNDSHGTSITTVVEEVSNNDNNSSDNTTVKRILRISCSFLRVADLEMDDEAVTCPTLSSCSASNSNSEPNIHHAAIDPPPGVSMDPKERWIALTTDTDGSHAPIAPIAMDRLANFGFTTSLNEPMWIADSKTDRILKTDTDNHDWMKTTFKPGKIRLGDDDGVRASQDEVLVWSGSFKHGFYGSDLPAIRAAAIVNMSAKTLMELLVDSNRVKEYNKLSLGRQDLVTFDGNLDTEGPFGKSITKVMKSETKPPMIRKTLVFVSILHAKELVDGSGYLIVTRAVHRPEDEKASMANAIQSEILMGVNLIRKVEGEEDTKCLMINVNHIRSPMVPMMVAKRIGVSSAVGFINDIRALCQ